MGKESIDGTETYKIKLVKEPVTVDGNKEDNITFYYFDADNFVPLVSESEIKYCGYELKSKRKYTSEGIIVRNARKTGIS